LECARDDIMMLAVRAGEMLLRSGAEVARVEDEVTAVCRAGGFPYAECFTTTTGIFVSLGQVGAGGDADTGAGGTNTADDACTTSNLSTIVKRVPSISTDFEKISKVHALVRRFTTGQLTLEQSIKEMDEIENVGHFKWPLRIVAVMSVAVFFAIMNGAALIDVAPALISGVAAWLISVGIEYFRINRFIAIFSGSFVAAALALLCFNLGFGSSLSSTIIGAITIFLPGVAITNAARDMLAGDMLAGTSRVVESLLIATAIALGVGLLLHVAPAPIQPDVRSDYTLLPQAVFALLGTMALCLVFNIPRRFIIIPAVISASGWVLYEAFVFSGESRLIACFVGACAVAILAECAAIATREPFTLFVIPAIWPLVPGIGMYNTMLNLIESNYSIALFMGIEALFLAGSIASAILIVTSLFRVANRVYRKIAASRASKDTGDN